MSDIMKPMPFAQLMDWALSEHDAEGTVFGVKKSASYEPGSGIDLFGGRIEAPFGPAAGPNTQLAQNLVAGYYAGARFFELKTVQVMDGAEMTACIPKPCIAPGDVCYNCEWSTELTCEDALGEYVKGWFAAKLLGREWGLGADDGFIFNMSVGYDLEGIQSPKVDGFIEGMKDASNTPAWEECRAWALANLDRFEHVDAAFVESISPQVSTSMTVSTMHGCPAEQIEAIVRYLLVEKGLDTCVKVNPTLMGYDFVRERLDSLGYGALSMERTNFEKDLQWDDAEAMFRRLIEVAKGEGRQFGIKVCNTLPVNVTYNELPSDQMYMSGVALFPLAIAVVHRIAKTFEGNIHISFSAGADENNIAELYQAGVWPVTLATALLRPSGYDRFAKMAENVGLVTGSGKRHVDVEAVAALDESCVAGDRYRRPEHAQGKRSLPAELPFLDCLACRACMTVCPNRANVVIEVPGFKRKQIVHVDGMCNECGNCAVFCPYEGRPYRNKPTIFWSVEDMDASENDGFCRLPDGTFRVRLSGDTEVYDVDDAACGLVDEFRSVVIAVRDRYGYLLGPSAER
ncbi:4Fe-4S dicluster domain-containing protein [Collinsella sp. An2]|uniref:4Fe-4S dicluster domain-containing protein n=1 Tax=Collinsella sp. An2 TaxID=1965585 RepID=UPI000B3AD4FB|nr:4Fe-4S dicluster domain-containing protein [Collinsella sp. An2]OUP08689.1 hypothetical protein B5F33_06650 [Collinsella sp. An2]